VFLHLHSPGLFIGLITTPPFTIVPYPQHYQSLHCVKKLKLSEELVVVKEPMGTLGYVFKAKVDHYRRLPTQRIYKFIMDVFACEQGGQARTQDFVLR
jgi:hypothetical protein